MFQVSYIDFHAYMFISFINERLFLPPGNGERKIVRAYSRVPHLWSLARTF